MFPFKEPQQGGDRFTAEDAQDRRLIVVPIEYIPRIRTARGDEVDGIRLNVVDLDNSEGPQTYFGTIWFGGRLIRTFRHSIGDGFCGYVTKVQTQGGFRAWEFVSLTSDEPTMKMAASFMEQNPEFMETCKGDVNMAKNQAQERDAGAADAQPQSPPSPRPAGPAPSAPPPPAPGNESVMQRLRREREQGQARVREDITGRPGNGEAPF